MGQPDHVTPMMAQYLEIKAANPDVLLFYRMGDFYEMFFEDAEAAAAALDIALTKRGKHKGADIPMCGVPVHAAESYQATLIRKGFRVAVCEQTEDPAEAKKRGSKSVVRREVARIVTPGTLTEEALLDPRSANRLAAWSEIRGEGALAWTDMSTGELAVTQVEFSGLGPLLARLRPREVLIRQDGSHGQDLFQRIEEAGAAPTPLGAASFESRAAEGRLAKLFGVTTLDGFGSFERPELSALGALADYLELTQKGRLPALSPPRREAAGGTMGIDAATRRNLELLRTLDGAREGSLLAAIDRTLTGAGARLLADRLSAPLTDPGAISARLDAVGRMVEDPDLRETLRSALREVPEIERALSRLALDRAGPRDLAAIRAGLAAAEGLCARLSEAPDLPEALAQARDALGGHESLRDVLEDRLVAEPPALLRDGGFVAAGADDDLDAARRLRDDGRGVIARMEAEHRTATGVQSLKIRHNNVLGYYIEVTANHAPKLTEGEAAGRYIHRQTMASAMRFTTVELSELESRIVNAGARALEIERHIFGELVAEVLAHRPEIAGTAQALAALDVAAALGDLAARRGWCRPRVDESRAFRISAGHHPVVEAALEAQGAGPFIANDTDLSAHDKGPAPIWLLTGPNMAGKSTFLRQNALIAILAQAGSFVPAAEAHIGAVDRLFSRVGAADDLARGRSTFMVEMVETAAILNQAGPRALVILDEIGRGTATYDGLSIAWAVLEHLHETNRCRGLFATHYHELTALTDRLDAVSAATVAVREWEGEVIFLHEVRPGAADRSYGVQVARLAGLPDAVIARAREVLERLESEEREGVPALIEALPLFAHVPTPPRPAPAPTPEIETRLSAIDPDALSPREALEALYELKALVAGKGTDA